MVEFEPVGPIAQATTRKAAHEFAHFIGRYDYLSPVAAKQSHLSALTFMTSGRAVNIDSAPGFAGNFAHDVLRMRRTRRGLYPMSRSSRRSARPSLERGDSGRHSK